MLVGANISSESRAHRLMSMGTPRLRWPRTVPLWLRQVIAAGLSFDPSERPADLGAMLARIRELQRAERSRRRRLRAMFWAPLISTVLVAIGVAVERAPRPIGQAQIDCGAQGEAIAIIWSAANVSELARAFSRANRELGGVQWREMNIRLGHWVQGWKAAKVAQCEASFPQARRVGMAPVLNQADAELARTCLEKKIAQLDALVQGWKKIEAPALARAMQVAEKLEPAGLCLDPVEVRAMAPLPDEPKQRARVVELQLELAKVSMVHDMERFDELEVQLPIVQRAIADLGDLALSADFSFFVAKVYEGRRDLISARRAYERGLLEALASGYWSVATRLQLSQSFMRHYIMRDENFSIHEALGESQAWLQAGGAGPRLRANHERLVGIRAFVERDFASAEQAFIRALDYLQRASDEDSSDLGRAFDDLGTTQQYLGRMSDSLKNLVQSLAVRTRLHGDANREVARAHGGIAVVYAALGRTAASIQQSQMALQSCLGTGAGDRGCGDYVYGLALALGRIGAHREAIDLWLRLQATGLVRLQLVNPEDPPAESTFAVDLAARGLLGEALILTSQSDELLAHDQLAPQLARMMAAQNRAHVLLRTGEVWRAQDAIREARSLADLQQGENVDALLALEQAEFLLAHEEFEAAIEAAETAAKPILEIPAQRARMHHVRARALIGLREFIAAKNEAEFALNIVRNDEGLRQHLRVPIRQTLAEIHLGFGDVEQALSEVEQAKAEFDFTELAAYKLAPLLFLEAKVRWETGPQAGDEARRLAHEAIRVRQAEGIGSREFAAEVQRWLDSHRSS
jgi:tetratricopeptide (TPR) repeat protein